MPAGCYTDEAFWQAELEGVLRPGWHAVARADELPEPGDYRSLTLFGEPLLLVRDEQRRLRAFSRVCLHRALPIVSGEGNAKRFTCPYHRWSYELDGRLCAAPFMEEVPGFVRDEGRLSLVCPECYARNAEESRYCTGCGVEFKPQEIPEKDLKEIPAPVKRTMKIVMAEHMDEVLATALSLEDPSTLLHEGDHVVEDIFELPPAGSGDETRPGVN